MHRVHGNECYIAMYLMHFEITFLLLAKDVLSVIVATALIVKRVESVIIDVIAMA